MDPSEQPLAGVVVLDLSQVYNGPYASFLMAHAGAEVIKVEPPGGEFLRRRNSRAGSLLPFYMLNANKRSISLNLKSDRGRELFLDLVEQADVVLENFAPGVMARLGVDHAQLCERRPDIIFASGSGYGQSGRYRDMPAMDLTVQALSGVMSTTGFAHNPPVKAGAAICDFFGGVHLYGAVVTALYHRERSGQGSRIDVAMLDAVYPALASNIGGLFSDRDDVPPRTGNMHGGLSLCPYNVYEARDGFIAIICNQDRHWTDLTRAMGREELASDPRFVSLRDRVANMDEVDTLVQAWTRTLDRTVIFDDLIGRRVPCAPVRELKETVADPHLHERGMLLEVEHPLMGRITVCRSPIRFEGRPPPAYAPAPEYGQDNELIYGTRLGLDRDAVQSLRDANVI